MSIKICHASIDENGKVSGGKVGDQTTKEICIREWYNKLWNVYLECTDLKIADKAATYAEQISMDDNFGYDQRERWTGYNSILKNNKKVKGAKGEFDCSSLIVTSYIFAGINMTPDGYTGNLRKKLLDTGKFKAYTDTGHVNSDKYAKRGGIYLREGSHVIIALEDAINPDSNFNFKSWIMRLQKEIDAKATGVADQDTLNKTPTLQLGSKNKVVGLLQEFLIAQGFNLGTSGAKKNGIDNHFGAKTETAIKIYQADVVKLKKPDGIVDSAKSTWKKILNV